MKAPFPPNEEERLKALYRYNILDTSPDEEFNQLTRLAASICGTPVALITLVDRDRQWFKSAVGWDASETTRDLSFCAHAISQPNGVLIVPDALDDERFNANPLVTSEPGIRFYAGAPLITKDGFGLGALCVIDMVPRSLNDRQTEALRTLSRQVMAQIELGFSSAERRRAEDALLEKISLLTKKINYDRIISTVTKAVHQSINLQEVLENAVESMSSNIGGARNVSIYLVEGEEAVAVASRGLPGWFIEKAGRTPYDRGFMWKTIIEGKPRYCPDVDEDTFIGPAGRELGTKSYLSMPIWFEGTTVGCLNIHFLEKNAFDEEELKLVEIVAQQIEIAFNNAQKTEALRKANEELELRVYERTQNLFKLNEELKKEIVERGHAEVSLQKANKELLSWIDELKEQNDKMVLLNEMGDLLQADLSADGIYSVVGNYARQLFPDDSGALCALDVSRNIAEIVTFWGLCPLGEREFPPSKCWALRRGRLHVVEDPSSDLLCRHVSSEISSAYLCAPILVQGGAAGILHLKRAQSSSEGSKNIRRELKKSAAERLVVTMVEHIGLALTNLRLRETLRNQAIHDPLTGLYNRRYLEEMLERELSRALRKEVTLGIIMLDIDRFKKVNDAYGHAAGDTFLRELGAFLQSRIRKEDIACRYGGEEFLLILPEASLDDTVSRAEELREQIKYINVQYRGQFLGLVTLSVGVAVFPDHGLTVDSLLRAADLALYRAKLGGRDLVVIAEKPY